MSLFNCCQLVSVLTDNCISRLIFAFIKFCLRLHYQTVLSNIQLKWTCIKLFSIDSVSPHLKNVVYVGGVKYGGDPEWQFAFHRYERTQTPSEKSKLLASLAATTDVMTLNRFVILEACWKILNSVSYVTNKLECLHYRVYFSFLCVI